MGIYPANVDNVLGLEEAGDSEIPESRQKLQDYLALREATKLLSKVEDEKLNGIRKDVSEWLLTNHPDWDQPGSTEAYREPNMASVRQKFEPLLDYLQTNHGSWIRGAEFHTTEAFLDATAGMYDDRELGNELNDKDGTFAFLVPMRMSRKYPEYGQEIETIIPALRYVPNEMRAWMMRGLPPFIADVYKSNEATSNKQGYLVCAPSITEDMKDDLAPKSLGEYISTAQVIVNRAVDFVADRLGVRVVGLGATLPALTKYGQSIIRPDVITTTGHGGTVELICGIIDLFTGKKSKEIGVVGLGAIGAAAAEIAADRYPDRKIHIFDKVRKKITNLVEKRPDSFEASSSTSEIIKKCGVVVSAVTEPIHLDETDVQNMEGTLLVDDSQPASISPENVGKVEEVGGNVVWAIGRDKTRQIARSGYDYGTMADGKTDLFGCEAEAAVLARYWEDLEANGRNSDLARKIVAKLAIRGPVTVQSAGLIGSLFRRYGVVPAEPQAFGRAVPVNVQ